MLEIVGVHQGVIYNASYVVEGEETRWRASLRRGEDSFSREGRLMHGWLDEADVRNRVHIAVQLYIEEISSGQATPSVPIVLTGPQEVKTNNQDAP
ncbi:hypothetical protein [Dyella kyungheensis]|uniref:Type II toxin-antitoxin system HicB family antitoxin n=1 Tax=Dyella kyungheensis TaxID=1242174 RepID=A0ABS2JTM8_9GAMM|nr:hypothetical protein [Dyella kyungheensis]MBM7121418.1 hypothetical protein [Dyella kyungheensis]